MHSSLVIGAGTFASGILSCTGQSRGVRRTDCLLEADCRTLSKKLHRGLGLCNFSVLSLWNYSARRLEPSTAEVRIVLSREQMVRYLEL